MTNWITDHNPFNLQPPPDWFLRALWERDRDLVIMPGLTQPVYRLVRKARRSLAGLAPFAHDSELARMVKHNVVPITSILATISYWPDVLTWLDRHDTWAVGGGENAADILDAQDRAAAVIQQRAQDDEAMARGGSGYRALKSRAGQTVYLDPSKGQPA